MLDAGHIVACPMGHALYRLTGPVAEIYNGCIPPEKFERIDDDATAPVRHARINRKCPHCGGDWYLPFVRAASSVSDMTEVEGAPA